jgi:uncharacterized protein with PQ loop repeat
VDASYCDLSRVLTFLAHLLITGGLYAQCHRTFRTRSSKDFNALLVAALLLGQTMSLNYGLAIREWPIITLSGLNLVPATLIAVGYWRYRAHPAAG